MKNSKNKANATKEHTLKATPSKSSELETELPLSEKDEVKKAEKNLGKPGKKN